jgi:hypothetical protein
MLEVVEEETKASVTTKPIRWCPYLSPTHFTISKLPDTKPRSNDIVSVIRGVITVLRDRLDLSNDTSTTQEVSISLAKLASLSDAEAVFYSYQQIFGRGPDPKNFSALLNGLRVGVFDRRQMIERLRHEPNAFRLVFINDAPDQGTAKGKNIDGDRVFYSIAEFDTDDVDLLLTNAYRAILKRDPRPSDRAASRGSMTGGASRSELLLSLLSSDEAKARSEPTAIFGITPVEEMFGLLFSSITRLSQIIVDHDYNLCLLKEVSEGPR